MNCEKGDLVVVVAPGVYPHFIGRVFRVTAPCAVYPESWDTDPPQYVEGFRQPCSFGDKQLRPIKDQPGEDEMLRITGKPIDTRTPHEQA